MSRYLELYLLCDTIIGMLAAEKTPHHTELAEIIEAGFRIRLTSEGHKDLAMLEWVALGDRLGILCMNV